MIMILNTITACNACQNTKDRLLKHLMNNCACCVEFIEMHRRRREGRHQGPICFGGILMKFSSRSLLQFSRHRLEHKLAQVMDSPNSSWSHLFVSLKHQLDVCCVFIRSQERKQGNLWELSVCHNCAVTIETYGGSVEQINKQQSKVTEQTLLATFSSIPLLINNNLSFFCGGERELAFESVTHIICD